MIYCRVGFTLGRGARAPVSFVARPQILHEVRIFSVSDNGDNGLGDEGTDGTGAMPPPRILGLEPPLIY